MKGTLKFIPAVGGVIAVATLPLLAYGWWLPFAGGLACGTGAAAAGFLLAYKLLERAVTTGNKGAAFAGLGLRIFIYLCVMSVTTLAFGLWAGIGAAAGCLTVPIAIIIHNIAAPKLRGIFVKRGPSSDEEGRQYIYEPHMRRADGAMRYVFMSGSYMEKAYGGRVYMTHRRFRKLAAIRRVPAGRPSGGYAGKSQEGPEFTAGRGARA
jgi:hypothetical protein